MHLSRADMKVYPLQYFLVAYSGVKILYFQHGSVAP